MNTVKLGVNVISLQNQRLIFDLNYVQKTGAVIAYLPMQFFWSSSLYSVQ